MLDQKTINDIVDHAAASDLARYNWDGRGRAPLGYVKGMAATFGLCLQKLQARDTAALAMVHVVDGEHDVFDHYQPQLRAAGLATEGASEVDRLRALFVILVGLGMRESSGRYCCGRDTTAAIPPSSDTVEAGLFQQSWDSRRASPEIPKLIKQAGEPTFLDIFKEGVRPQGDDLNNYGSGDGRAFQATCKISPAIAVQCAAVGLRTLYTHWGPIVRHEVELAPAANALFKQVQDIVGVSSTGTAGKPAPVTTGWWAAFLRWLSGSKTPVPPVRPVDPAKPISGQLPWMAWAAREVGFHETASNRNLGRYTGPAKCGSEGDPWCAIFVNAGLESSGIRGTRSAMARSFEEDPNFVTLSGPAFGAIVTMWRGAPKPRGQGHVFFYLGHLDNSRVLALGGNQSDQVCRQAEPTNRIVGYYWPKSVPLPKTGKITVEDDGNQEGSET